MAAWGGVVPDELYDRLSEAQNAYNVAIANATDETLKLVAAADINDEKHKELIQTYGKWRGDLQRIDQDEKTYNRTRDRVIKQIGEQKDGIEAVMATIEEWVEREKQAALERYEANLGSFADTFEAFAAYQDRMAAIDAEAEAKRAAARKKAEDKQKAEAEKARQERQAAAEKAYQNAQNKIAKVEAAQLNTLKSLYANGLMDKQTYEAQKAVVEEDYLKQRMATAEKYGRDTDTFMNQLLDRQIARMEKAKAMLKEEADEMARYYEGLRTEDGGRGTV